jgi:alpha,alpha-trehalase
MSPFFFHLAPAANISAAAVLKNDFLKAGGVVTTLKTTGQQWDAPNGWAPLQWITIKGLENYGRHDLAKDIALRWVALNTRVFHDTGKLMEKYNVVDTGLSGGGGEYPSQDGFGWTNGVLLKLIDLYNLDQNRTL